MFLHGATEYFGRSRDYYVDYADAATSAYNYRCIVAERIGKWRTGGKAIGCDYRFEQGYAGIRTKVVNGCRVEVHYHDLPSTRLSSEEWFDISHPKLKLIHCAGRDTHSTKYPRVIRRNFARLGERWVEV